MCSFMNAVSVLPDKQHVCYELVGCLWKKLQGTCGGMMLKVHEQNVPREDSLKERAG